MLKKMVVSTSEVCLVEEGSEATGGPPAALEGPDKGLALFREGWLLAAAWAALAEGLRERTVRSGGIMDLEERRETVDHCRCEEVDVKQFPNIQA